MRAAFGLEPSPQKITPPFIVSPFKRVKQHRSDWGDELCNLVVLHEVRRNAMALRRLGYYTVWIILWFRVVDSRNICCMCLCSKCSHSFLQETKQRSKPKSSLERFKNDMLAPLRLGKILFLSIIKKSGQEERPILMLHRCSCAQIVNGTHLQVIPAELQADVSQDPLDIFPCFSQTAQVIDRELEHSAHLR